MADKVFEILNGTHGDDARLSAIDQKTEARNAGGEICVVVAEISVQLEGDLS